jgi:hypothetical protein
VAAQRVQRELGADVASDAPTAEALVRARVDAVRDALADDPAADAAVLGRREAILAAAAVAPPLSDADVTELRRLADDLGRAARIRQRTEARFAEVLMARVAASTGVALHPTAVRDAAEAVLAAERGLEDATDAVTDLGPDPGDRAPSPRHARQPDLDIGPVALEDLANVPFDPVLQQPQDDFDEARLVRRRSRVRAFAVLAIGIGAALVLLPFGSSVLAGGVFVLGVVLAVLELVRGHRAGRAVDEEDDGITLERLESVSAAVAATASGRAAAALAAPPELDRREAWLSQRVRLDAARDEAEELLRVARNRWHQLAGPSAEPHDVDNIVKAHDPQLAYSERLADTSPTVRTVAAFHRKAQARWRVLWAALGRETAPEPERLEAVLDELLGDHRRAVADAQRLAEAEARAQAAETVQRPIVLAAPSAWLAPGQLAQLLASVPPEGRVVVIETVAAGDPADAEGSS